MDFYDLKGKRFLVSQKAFILDGEKLLIIKNSDDIVKDFSEAQNTWSVPGGIIEIDEDFATGLKREVKEETGLEIQFGKIFSVRDFYFDNFKFNDGTQSNVRFIELGFLCNYQGGQIVLSDEHSDYKWVRRDELKNYSFSKDVAKLMEDYLSSVV